MAEHVYDQAIRVIRHGADQMTSVYRDTEYLGSALPILRSSDYAVTGWTSGGPCKYRAEFSSEQEAINYLTGEG